ncbi:MAG: helix-turn-helix domain-containing protein [Candidatus Aminicenantes bacterium]|nr:helix-turn-helix domain-containing protein [Candidatus Aminicenantes bacterium]
MASLGQELQRERELRGISLQEIADSTRISLRFLQAVEEDRLDRIPGAFFVRAILRSYARGIGIDEHQVLNKYQEMQAFAEPDQDKNDASKRKRPPRSPVFSWRWLILGVGAAVVIALGLVLFSLFSGPPEEPPALMETSLPASVPVGVVEPPGSAGIVVEEIKGLLLQVDFSEETWLQIYADGESIWDGIKTPGESLEVTARREVRLSVGNAGGLRLTINGQQAKPFGPRGAVRTNIRITPENYRDFLAPDER